MMSLKLALADYDALQDLSRALDDIAGSARSQLGSLSDALHSGNVLPTGTCRPLADTAVGVFKVERMLSRILLSILNDNPGFCPRRRADWAAERKAPIRAGNTLAGGCENSTTIDLRDTV
jgi:hypothetical protein